MHKIINLKISRILANNKSLVNKVHFHDLNRKNCTFRTNPKSINSYLNFDRIPGLLYLSFNKKKINFNQLQNNKPNQFLNIKIISITGGG